MEIDGRRDVDGIEGSQRRLSESSCAGEQDSIEWSQCEHVDQFASASQQ